MDAYRTLLLKAPPRSIRSQADYKKALRAVEMLMTKPHLAKAESEYVELLSTLIEHYESQEFPTPKVSQSNLLAHLIAERGMTQAAVARETQISRGTLSNVLAGRRELSKQNIAKLSSFFRIGVGSWF